MRARTRETNATPPCPGPPVRTTSTGAPAFVAAATRRSTVPAVRPPWSSGTVSVEHVNPCVRGQGREPVSRGAGAAVAALPAAGAVRDTLAVVAGLPPPPQPLTVTAATRAMP